MAVSTNDMNTGTSPDKTFQGRHVAIGLNVFLGIALAVAIAGTIQWVSYLKNAKVDLTDQGVNSLTPGTERLLSGLDQKVRLTSLYFETDLEEEDQGKYRTRMNDLIDLFESTNRTKIEVAHFNPLQDHAKREKLLERLNNLPKFKEQTQPYADLIERYRSEVAANVGQLIRDELATVDSLIETTQNENEKDELGQVRQLLDRWREELGLSVRDIDDAVDVTKPRYEAAIAVVSDVATNLSRDLGNVVTFGKQRIDHNADMSAEVRAFFAGINERYGETIQTLQSIGQETRELPALDYEEVLRQIRPTSNALVVETDQEAKVLGFADVWPPMDPNMPARAAGFGQRLFKGEEKIASAILQLTEEDKTAVTFVRYGGEPLFSSPSGAHPRQAYYTKVKDLLEEANFVVNEWDLSMAPVPPAIDPPPSRTLYIVLRPSLPANPMQQQQPQFSEADEKKLLDAMGESPRALFLAGWSPGPFGAYPDPYPFDNYLNDNWGIHVASDILLINAVMGQKPGEYSLAQSSLFIDQFDRSDHLLVRALRGQHMTLPYLAPLDIASDLPEGVAVQPLFELKKTGSLWGVKDVTKYIESARQMKSVKKDPNDIYGPFTVAAAAQKGDAKIVVISSRDCMSDGIAAMEAWAITSEGPTRVRMNPGNIRLLVNTLHWLNDRTEWLDVGVPVGVATIEIEEGPALNFVRAFVYGVWPAVALCFGGVAWWIRRR